MLNCLIILTVIYLFSTLWYSWQDYLCRRSLKRIEELIKKIREEHPVVRAYLEGDRSLEDKVKDIVNNKSGRGRRSK